MALIEVDEQNFRAASQVVSAFETMLKHPGARKLVLQAQKTVNPNLAIPELDAPAAGFERINQLQQQLDAQKQALEDEKKSRVEEKRLNELTSRWDASRGKLRKAGWSDEGIGKIEKFMEEKLIGDHEVAAAAYERLYPEPAAISPSSNRLDMFSMKNVRADTDESTKMLLSGDDEGFLSRMIPQTLAEIRTGR